MKRALSYFEQSLAEIQQAGTSKEERVLTTAQGARISTRTSEGVLNMCANNYLGLSNNPELIAAAKASYDRWGFDAKGFDRKGFDQEGFNAKGLDRDGFDRQGFDVKGFDKEGFDRDGFDAK